MEFESWVREYKAGPCHVKKYKIHGRGYRRPRGGKEDVGEDGDGEEQVQHDGDGCTLGRALYDLIDAQ